MKLNIQIFSDMIRNEWLRDLVLRLRSVVDNGRLGFGDGVAVDNIYGTWATYTTNGVANTEDTVVHNLGVVPVGFITVSLDKGAVIYKGTTTWTTTSIFLKCNTATVAARLFILGPSNQGS